MKNLKAITGYVLLGLLIFYIGITLIAPDKTIKILGFRTFIVVSSSMEPDIHVNDMIFIKRPKEDALDVRDAITFLVYIPELNDKSYVTHYIGEITEDENGTTIYKTQGATKLPGDYDDWTDSEGNPIDIMFDDIEGQYMFKIPYIGYIITMLRDPIFVGLLAVNGVIIYFIIKLFKSTKNGNKKET